MKSVDRVTVRVVGIQGPPGADRSVTHSQPEPSLLWSIAHGLPFAPGVHAVGADGHVVMGAVRHEPGVTFLEFSEPVAGVARLT
jgi:hypothetical protein